MQRSPFVGRVEELQQLEDLKRKPTASLVVIFGRRRIGKSRLVEEFAKNTRFLRFSGIPPTSDTTAQDQRDVFAEQLAKQLNYPKMVTSDWSTLFSLLQREAKSGKVVILFDEISWMGSHDRS